MVTAKDCALELEEIRINGTNLIEAFDMIRDRQDVESVVVVGEIGGDAEEQLADYLIKTKFSKPLVAYIAGRFCTQRKENGARRCNRLWKLWFG